MASDFHSHRSKSAARTLISCTLEELSHHPLVSLELHPWFLPERFEPLSAAFRTAARRAAAIGEIGLDRLRGPSLEIQTRYLDALLELASSEAKPVVLHCVRAIPELLSAMKRHPGMSCLFHGFRGKPELLEKLRNCGFYVSLNPNAIDHSLLFEHLKRTGLERIGFETDDSPEPIESVLSRAAARLDMSPACLETITDRNFSAFLALP